MINPDLDPGRWQRELSSRGRTQIENFLDAAAARQVQQCLAQQVPWTLALHHGGSSRVLSHAELTQLEPATHAGLLADLARASRGEDGFAYESYMMVRAYREGRDPDLLLHAVLEFLNSPAFISIAWALTGDPSLRRVSAQASRYRPGHFLKRHNDLEVAEGRKFAYVINLTSSWRPDWGGLLQFLDGDARVIETFLPRWNTLSLFKVPADHCVSLVTPWAQEDRLSIAGWFLS